MNEEITPIVDYLKLLKDDPIVVKRVKDKIDKVIFLLQQEKELTVEKAVRELSEFDSSEIPAYDRTLLWDVLSMLEGLSFVNKP